MIPDGDAGIAATIARMKSLVNGPQGVRSLTVRKYALDAARGTERGMNEIEAIFDHIQRDIEFRGESGETLQSPEATINLGAGDCDDHSMLEAAVLQSLGYDTQFRAISLVNNSPGDLSHVYVLVRDKRTGRWFPLDNTVEASYPGWEPNNAARVEDYGLNSGSNIDLLAGLGVLVLGLLL
jgi:transglutaminase-like putative cysteine protease